MGLFIASKKYYDESYKTAQKFYYDNGGIKASWNRHKLEFNDFYNRADIFDDSEPTFWKFWREVEYWHEVYLYIWYVYSSGSSMFEENGCSIQEAIKLSNLVEDNHEQ
ncbi:MAG: hypothetical protein KC414_04760, partial [Romboutsia sp.]|nr:hypothetical protein [Romboutsia sp.]